MAHNYGHHVVVQTINPITGIYGEDIHVMFDGRMSRRTATEHLVRTISNRIRSAQIISKTPLVATSYYRLGVNDSNEYPVPMSPRDTHVWGVRPGFTVTAYRPLGRHHDTPWTSVTAPDGKTYDIHFSFDKHNTGKTHTASIHDTTGKRVEFSSVNAHTALLVALNRLEALISA